MWNVKALLVALGALFAAGVWMMETPPQDAASNAAAWLSAAGFPELARGLTAKTDLWVTWGLWALLVTVIFLLCLDLARNFRERRKRKVNEVSSFDVPMSEAVEHYNRTVPHSYRDGVDRHAFEALHKAMCAGKLPVVGIRGEDASSESISARECKRLKPRMVVVPRNRATPRGVRFDLMEGSESSHGYTSLRVRSRDLYRLWPKDEDDD